MTFKEQSISPFSLKNTTIGGSLGGGRTLTQAGGFERKHMDEGCGQKMALLDQGRQLVRNLRLPD